MVLGCFTIYPLFFGTNCTMKYHKKTILTLLLFCLAPQLTCYKNPTESKTGTLTGKVLLEGQPTCADKQDHSGINVALYKLAELDTTILRYNHEHLKTKVRV